MTTRSRALFALLVFGLLLAMPMFASTTSSMPWDDGLQKILNALSGTTVKIIATMMIIGAGLMLAFSEGQALKTVMWIVVGLGIALNAASFLTMMFGNTSGALVGQAASVMLRFIG